jgi:hypothetical protein
MATTRRTPFALLVLGAAAVLSSWNPASAPLGLAVGLLAGALALKARREEGTLAPALRAALILAAVAVVLSGIVIARAGWAGRAGDGTPIVDGVPRTERMQALDRAAEATRAGREGARKELEAVEPRR